MAKNYVLKAEKRDRAGKGIARALRRESKVPAVIYGDNKEPITISLPAKEITLEFHKGHMFTSLCEIDLDGEKHRVLARDIQLHPVKDNVLHVDFLRVNQKTKLKVMVPVQFTNEEESPGLKDKGVLNIVRHELELVCRAISIPEYIEVDLSKAEIGDTIKTDEINLPDGTELADTDREYTIATIAAPRLIVEEEEEAEEGAEGEAAEGAEGAEAEGEGEAAEGGEAPAEE